MDEGLIIEIWDIFKEYVPEKNREVAANQYVDFLVDKDVDASALKSLVGYDSYLDDAIKYVLEEDEAFEDEDDSYEEDE